MPIIVNTTDRLSNSIIQALPAGIQIRDASNIDVELGPDEIALTVAPSEIVATLGDTTLSVELGTGLSVTLDDAALTVTIEEDLDVELPC